jgi:hypothetical protein
VFRKGLTAAPTQQAHSTIRTSTGMKDPSANSSSSSPTFDSLLKAMIEIPLAAPYYVCITGPEPGQAAVIARNLTGADQVLRIAANTTAGTIPTTPMMAEAGAGAGAGAGSAWFLAQTNYDHWLPDPAADPRRSAAGTIHRVDRDGLETQ